jgi:hypothetical protein
MSFRGSKKIFTGVKKSHMASKNLKDYEPGASQAEILVALKKVANLPKPS